MYREVLGGNLIGVYVHGSIAFGCFSWDRSDIDFIVVVKAPVSMPLKARLLQVLVDLEGQTPVKGFEMSVVLEKYCKDFVYPTPYELHFSNDLLDEYLVDPQVLCDDMHKTDYDLAAHFTVINRFGIVAWGLPVQEVFGDVPDADYLDSIRRDVESAAEDVACNPVYVILNLCRVYAYMRDGLVVSKEQGGLWGLDNLPRQYRRVIVAVLDEYVSGVVVVAGEALQADFVAYMLGLIYP